jgi:hypothetical protein
VVPFAQALQWLAEEAHLVCRSRVDRVSIGQESGGDCRVGVVSVSIKPSARWWAQPFQSLASLACEDWSGGIFAFGIR